MPHSTTIKPIEPRPTCATCPFFSSFNGEERGLCEVFDRVFKRHNLRTSDCDKEIESLLKQPKTCTVVVDLVTSEVEDDGFGYPVPIDSQTVEINVAQPMRGLIRLEIASRKDLEGWKVANFWQKQLDGDFEI